MYSMCVCVCACVSIIATFVEVFFAVIVIKNINYSFDIKLFVSSPKTNPFNTDSIQMILMHSPSRGIDLEMKELYA